MDAREDPELTLAEERERLLRDAQAIDGLAEAIAVFEAASARAPHVPPPQPDFWFSTGANA
jgi:hypothetical protein